jgi:tricorn protease
MKLSTSLFASLILACAAAPVTFGAEATIHLLQKPAMNKTHIVFSYAGDLWIVGRQGGLASRLTAATGFETEAAFSPDGNTLAFTGEYDGNVDVFTMPVTGGVPKRLTYHPDADRLVGFTPDGKRVLFRSNRGSFSRFTQLYTVPVEGGLPEVLPLPMACTGAYSPDGKRMVYAPLDGGQFAPGFTNFVAWKRYRGGEASYLWLVNFADLSTVKIPRTDSNDINPMWIGDKVYFLSDRGGAPNQTTGDRGAPMTLYRYDPALGTQAKAVTRLIENNGKDIVSASAGPGGIVYEQFGKIFIYDLATNKSNQVPVEIAADLTEVRPHFQNVSREVRNAKISPTGVRAVFEAHGEIVTVPAEHGDIRNLTHTPGVMERNPVWSPDGKSIAYFSDESGEYALHIKAQSGEGDAKKIPLAGHSAFYFDPKWSPDSKNVAFTDNELNLWSVDVAAAKLTKIDTDYSYELDRNFAWSGDSKWIAFVKSLPNQLHAISVYSLDSDKSTQITDGMSDARNPAFDRDGQYLYFTASTNYGPTVSGLDMTSDEHEVTSNIYLVVLANNVASPLAPESDEEKIGEAGSNADGQTAEGGAQSGGGGRGGRGGGAATANTPPKPVRIDFDKILQRTIALPLPARNYRELTAGRAGVLYFMEPGGAGGRGGGAGGGGSTLSKYDLKTRRTEKLADNVASFDLSANGEKMLLRTMPAGAGGGRGGRGGNAPEAPPQYVIVSALAPIKTGEGALHMADMEINIEPIAEWKQMYHEVWRIERSYFYDPNLHGVNAADGEKEYDKYIESLSSRADLNYIFKELLSEFTVGHLRGGGGTIPEPKRVQGGLLGADYEIVNGHYRIKKIYTGESWNPQMHAPLSEPGLNVAEGDYLLSVNGQELKGADDISRLLEDTANKAVLIKVASDASGANSRELTVTPIASEAQLRHEAWVEGNRRKVDQLSGGKLAYVYMPDTGQGGLTAFTRYYFAQTDKQGAVIDERYNSGGQVADYVIEVMNRQLLGWWQPRWGAIYRTPAAQIFGPKVMIINEMAGSGGDMMPWMFRYSRTGQLVGKRTWGGLVGVSQYPALMDGGNVTSPSFGFFSPKGQWDVENHGTPPDVEVDMDPKAVHDGHDPQLEKAVAIAMEEMKTHPVPQPNRPPFPNYQAPPARTTTGGGNQ